MTNRATAPFPILSSADVYGADYYLDGVRSGLSLYENYRWLPELSVPMVHRIVTHLNADPADTFLDFGCARGYVVRALRTIGYTAYGLDASDWAIANCDPHVTGFVRRGRTPWTRFDWILAKDVLEHIPAGELERTLTTLHAHANKGLFVVVPLSAADEQPYVVPEYEKDVTHVQRRTLASWQQLLEDRMPGATVESVYRIEGIKDNYAHYPQGNGFLTVTR